jgi:hypothetical protein
MRHHHDKTGRFWRTRAARHLARRLARARFGGYAELLNLLRGEG